jgi:tRNA(fMet)-specific endonuclease VapC
VARIAKTAPAELGIPTIVLYEIEYGTLRSKLSARRRNELERGLTHMTHLPFDSEAAVAAARIRFELEKRGAMIGPLDVLIAGTALSRGALLVTNNVDEFSRVPGLRVADWRGQV